MIRDLYYYGDSGDPHVPTNTEIVQLIEYYVPYRSVCNDLPSI